MSLDSQDGWAARRNGTCYSNEAMLYSGAGIVKCCPSDKIISEDDTTNFARCLDTKNKSAMVPPQCSNSSLALWRGYLGFFCCDQDLAGYSTPDPYKGCASEDMIDTNNSWTRMTKYVALSGKWLEQSTCFYQLKLRPANWTRQFRPPRLYQGYR